MQTTTAPKAGNAPDLLQGILSVQVRNEDKITEQDRVYCQTQQNLLYKTLDQIDRWYAVFNPKQNPNGTSVRTTHPGFLLRCTKNRFRLMSCLKPFACNRKSPQQKQGLCKQPLFNLRSVWRYWK